MGHAHYRRAANNGARVKARLGRPRESVPTACVLTLKADMGEG